MKIRPDNFFFYSNFDVTYDELSMGIGYGIEEGGYTHKGMGSGSGDYRTAGKIMSKDPVSFVGWVFYCRGKSYNPRLNVNGTTKCY